MKNWLLFLIFAVIVLVLGNCSILSSSRPLPSDVHDGVSRSEILSTLKKHDKYIKEYVYYEMDKNHDRSIGKMNEILTKLKRIEDRLDDIEKVVRKLD